MYDLIIIGSGPAGLTASIYASCFHLNNLVIGKVLGGQMFFAHKILNYPGFEEISGEELTQKMASQVKLRGAEILTGLIVSLAKKEGFFEIKTENEKIFQSKALILATGTEKRKLNIPGEAQYTSKGVFYCVPCEGQDYTNQTVAVVGGGNSAATSSVHLAQKAAKVYLIYRGAELRCDPIWLSQIKNNPKIEIFYNSQIIEILGDGEKVTGATVKSGISNTPNQISLNKVYIEIGGVPGSALLISLGAKVDEGGFIKVDENLMTNIEGVFAAGDVVNSKLSIEQISSAVGLGSRAGISVFSYLKGKKTANIWGQSLIQR